MRILYISGWYPYPPDNGARIREFNLIKQLAFRHEITLLSFYSSPGSISQERLDAMQPHCRSVAAVPYKEFNPTGLRAVMALFSTRPRSVVDTYNPEMARLVESAVDGETFDVAVLATQRTVPYAHLIGDIPWVCEEIEQATLYEKYLNARNLAAKLRYRLMWWKQANYVRGLLTECSGGTVASEQERDLILNIRPDYASLVVVSNGVDLEANTGDFGPPKPDTLIYNGALTYDANFDAMEFFLRDIFPLVKAQRPNVSLRITGKYDGVPVERLPLGDGAELTGYLDDVRPAVAQSWVCVVPLRVGGGTRLKILEAMALGTPVVSTSKGAEGLKSTHGENILIADDPNDFAQTLVRLLQDDSLRVKLSTNGRRLVEEWYSWEICARQLEQLLHKVVGDEIPSSD
ncbi:MAG: glycosyltransferase [Chloroflexi bacterium]|nr:glycosyltransferase [Chloroflexota bacterium]